MRVFLREISTWIGGLSKAHGPLRSGWPSLNPLKASMEQKRQTNVEAALCLTVWAETWVCSCPQRSCSWVLGPRQEHTQSALQLSGLQTTSPASWGSSLQMAVWVLSLHNHTSEYLIIHIFLDVCAYVLVILFLWRTRTNIATQEVTGKNPSFSASVPALMPLWHEASPPPPLVGFLK